MFQTLNNEIRLADCNSHDIKYKKNISIYLLFKRVYSTLFYYTTLHYIMLHYITDVGESVISKSILGHSGDDRSYIHSNINTVNLISTNYKSTS
jgi:hypothetical protein